MIGICGPKGSGKSTAAKFLQGHPHDFSRHRFAGPLKDALKVAFGLTDEHVDGALKEEPTELLNGRTPRHAMLTMGTEWGRNMIHKDIWLTAWRNTMPDSNRIIVDDVRFPNEIEMLRQEYGATTIRIVRPGFEHDSSHESEAHSELMTEFAIVNDSSLAWLKAKVESIVMGDIRRRIDPNFKLPAFEDPGH
jgi:energy-coupling factor transporter ATP-binding protein EcfA2